MENTTGQRTRYRIKIKGPLDRFSADWNGDITVIFSAAEETLLDCRFLDQAALRGFMNQLWNLNFTVLSVELTDNPNGEVSQPTETERRQA